jgi:hypothetical protein
MGTAINGTYNNIKCVIEGAHAGDFYLNTIKFFVYTAVEDDVWNYIGTIKGEKGNTGNAGILSFDLNVDTGMLTMTVSDDYVIS